MSKQLSVAAAFAIFASSVLALFAPGSAKPSDALARADATTLAASAFSAELPFSG